MKRTPWTPERDALLSKLWRQRRPYMTAAEIAVPLGTTKSAVIARASRLRLPSRDAANKTGESRKAAVQKTAAALIAKRDAQAAELRRIVTEERLPVVVAGRRMGLSDARIEKLRRRYGIRAAGGVVTEYRQRTGSYLPLVNAPLRSKKVGLTEAQHQNILNAKRRMWSKNVFLDPVSDDEAARLIAEHIARKGVTKCPDAAPIQGPINSGLGWR